MRDCTLLMERHAARQRNSPLLTTNGVQDYMIKGPANVDTSRQLLLRLEEIDDHLFSNMRMSKCHLHPILLTAPAGDHLAG